MPVTSKRQYRFVMSMRSKYNNPLHTPEKNKWIWNDEWDAVDFKELPENELYVKYQRKFETQL